MADGSDFIAFDAADAEDVVRMVNQCQGEEEEEDEGGEDAPTGEASRLGFRCESLLSGLFRRE